MTKLSTEEFAAALASELHATAIRIMTNSNPFHDDGESRDELPELRERAKRIAMELESCIDGFFEFADATDQQCELHILAAATAADLATNEPAAQRLEEIAGFLAHGLRRNVRELDAQRKAQDDDDAHAESLRLALAAERDAQAVQP